jgi:hypothetical protein
LCYRPFHGEIDDLKLYDTLRNIDDVFNEKFLVQTQDDEAQLLAEGITLILFLSFDSSADLSLRTFGSGITDRIPRRLPSTTGIESFGISVQSFEIRPDSVSSDVAAGLNCVDAGSTKMSKAIFNLEIKSISDGVLTTTILTTPSYGCLFDMMSEVPKFVSAGSRLQSNPNSRNVPVMYIVDATKVESQLHDPGFFDSFTFKTGSLDAYQSYGVVQMVQLPPPQLPNGLASMTLWMSERSSNFIHFPLTGYRPILISGLSVSANAFSSTIPFQGQFARVDVFNSTNIVMGSVLRPTASPEFISYPWIMNFVQMPTCDDKKDIGTLTYTAGALQNSDYNKDPRLSVGSILLKCHGFNDAPYVSSPMPVIDAEKNLAMKISIQDVDSRLVFLALSKMPQKLNIYQTDEIASSNLGLVSLIPHAVVDVGWVTSIVSINEQKCLENCQNQAIVGPIRFAENGNGFRVGAAKILTISDALEVTVSFANQFYAKTFDVYAEIPEGTSLTISAVKVIDGLESYQSIWQGVPKPETFSQNSFTSYGKQRILKKKMWTIDTCPSWVFTSRYKFEFSRPVGVQLVMLSAIYARAYNGPVSGAFMNYEIHIFGLSNCY